MGFMVMQLIISRTMTLLENTAQFYSNLLASVAVGSLLLVSLKLVSLYYRLVNVTTSLKSHYS